MAYHHTLGPDDAHAIHSWVYATIADRDAHNPSQGNSDPITAEDVDLRRVCYVASNGIFYYLKALGPPVQWGSMGDGFSGSISEDLVEFNGFGHDHSGGTAGAPITLGSLSGIDSFVREAHKITAAEVAAGYFYLDHGYALDPGSVFISVVNGVTQVNNWGVAGSEAAPDFDVLTDYPDRIYINNNAEAYGLSGDIAEGDVLLISYLGTPMPFTIEWTVAGDEAARTVSLPLVQARAEGVLAYDLTVDWGDGVIANVTAWDDSNATHIYSADGVYRSKISGIMEGWSFNNTGDSRLKITRIINWGGAPYFGGFKYLKGAFHGCSNLASLGFGKIPASDTGVLTDGFANVFTDCSSVVKLSAGIFDNHPNVTGNTAFQNAFNGCSNLLYVPYNIFKYQTLISGGSFQNTFANCSALEWIPGSLFDYQPLVTGFYQTFAYCSSLKSIPATLFVYNVNVLEFFRTFRGCAAITEVPAGLFDTNTLVTNFNRTFDSCSELVTIPSDLFRYNTLLASTAFFCTFAYCGKLAAIPVDLFRYNTLVGYRSFDSTFFGCESIVTIPPDLFRYNVLVGDRGFYSTFTGCHSLISIPPDLFRYNTQVGVDGFFGVFWYCDSLTTVPEGLFRYNTLCNNFTGAFWYCTKLQLNRKIFYEDGEQMTRFLNQGQISFDQCFALFATPAFQGVQGEAPDLWNCDCGESIVLDVAPSVDWAPGDVITGQSSGATSEVVYKVSSLEYRIYKHLGNYSLGEIVGVTGVPDKLADQGAANPTFVNKPIATAGSVGCFHNHSIASVSNYADIPDDWRLP